MGRVINTSHYSGLAASLLTRKQMERTLRVTTYRLGKMLGVPQPHGVYQWGARYRISALYLERMIHLLFLHNAGKLNVQTFPGTTYWNTFVAEGI